MGREHNLSQMAFLSFRTSAVKSEDANGRLIDTSVKVRPDCESGGVVQRREAMRLHSSVLSVVAAALWATAAHGEELELPRLVIPIPPAAPTVPAQPEAAKPMSAAADTPLVIPPPPPALPNPAPPAAAAPIPAVPESFPLVLPPIAGAPAAEKLVQPSTVGPQPAVPADPAKAPDPVQELAKKLEALGKNLTVLTADEQIKIVLGGLISADFYYNHARPLAPGIPFFLTPRSPFGFNTDTYDANARQTTLFMLI